MTKITDLRLLCAFWVGALLFGACHESVNLGNPPPGATGGTAGGSAGHSSGGQAPQGGQIGQGGQTAQGGQAGKGEEGGNAGQGGKGEAGVGGFAGAAGRGGDIAGAGRGGNAGTASGGRGGEAGGGNGGTPSTGGMGGGLDVGDSTTVCRAAVAALNARYDFCAGHSTPAAPHVREDSSMALCPDLFFAPGSNRTPANVMACIDVIKTYSCEDLLYRNVAPPCILDGQRPAGAFCAYASQCQSGQCSATANMCGTCKAASDLGGFCSTGTDCQAHGAVCINNHCVSTAMVSYGGLGAPCARGTLSTCQGDAFCWPLNSQSDSPWQCKPLPPGLGEPCTLGNDPANPPCRLSNVCQMLDGRAICAPAADACAGHFCDDQSSACLSVLKGPCVPLPTLGEACTVGGSCTWGLVCVAQASGSSMGTCMRPAGQGEACSSTRACSDVLKCVSGQCKALDTAICN